MPSRFRIHDTRVAWRVADDEAVVLHADSSAYFGLNQVGTMLWLQLADHSMALEHITTWARSAFHDAPEHMPGEVSAFIDELLENDLIEVDEGTESTAPRQLSGPAIGGAPPWEAPTVERFGELEKLILSGE